MPGKKLKALKILVTQKYKISELHTATECYRCVTKSDKHGNTCTAKFLY